MADYSAPQQGGGILPQSMSDLASGLIDPSLTGGQYLNPAYATPAQRANLYALSTALTQPQQIKNGWQGIASMANALIGGYYGGQADRMEQGGTLADQQRQQILNQVSGANGALAPSGATSAPAAYGGLPSGTTSPGGVPSPGAGASGATPDGTSFPDTQAGHEAFIRSYAAAKGVNPDFAAAVAGSEGLRALSPQNPNSASTVDREKDGAPFSFGDFQLNVHPGAVGDQARNAGIDPADPTQWQAANKFAIDYMANNDVRPWKGDQAVELYRAGTGQKDYATPRMGAQPAAAPRAGVVATAINAPLPPPRPPGLGEQPPAPTVASGAPVDRLAPGLVPGTDGGMGGGVSPAVAVSPALPPQRPSGLAYAPSSVPPAVAAMGAALRGAPPQSGAGSPYGAISPPTGAPPPPSPPPSGPAPAGASPPPPGVTPQELAFAMSSPNMSPAQKMQLMDWAQPKTYQDVNGNVSTSYFNRPTGAPIANIGRQDEVTIGSDGSVHVPVQTTGPVGAGTTRLFGQPLTPGGGAAGAGSALAPVIGLGNEARANANTQNQIATQKAAWAQQNLDAQKQETALRFSAAPLYQLKGILDQNGGQLPTGVGADKVMDFGSAANFITSLLGHPLDSADTPDKISSLQLFNKYGTQLQQAMAAGILPGNATNASLEFAGHTSPGIGLSNTVNVHLIDNLTRMNDLRIKYAQDFQQYYKGHNGDMSDWNNAWVKSISGNNAIPLSKYPIRESKLPDGTAAGEYASTDPSGFHWFPKAAVQ